MSGQNSTSVIPAATFESIAVERGWLDAAQVDECRALHLTIVDMGLNSSLMEVYVKRGYLSTQQCAQLESALGKSGAITIPGYEIIGKIAEGGMGAIYKAKQTSMDRLVAIKVLLQKFADDKDGRERFMREARAVAKLSHPNVVAGIDVGEAQGICYFVMEFLDGMPMDAVLRERGPLPWREAAQIVVQVARALDHAHQHGIVHRDVKPGNIMLLKDGVAKLADLGLARVHSTGDSTITQSGMIVGSPAYLSPEQAIGDREIDARSDLFSLGLTLFELIAGQRAFGSGNPMSTITALLTRDVPVARLAEMDAPADIAEVVRKMTRREPEQRYANARQLLEDLDAVLSGHRPMHAYARDVRSGPLDPDSQVGIFPALRPDAARTAARSSRAPVIAVVAILLTAGWLAWKYWPDALPGVSPAVVATSKAVAEAELDLLSAIELAAAEVPQGRVYHAELEHDEFSIDFAVDRHTVNVVVDAIKGEINEQLIEDEDHSEDVSVATIGLVEALRAALRQSAGTPVEAQILLLPGRAVVEVKLLREGRPVWIDVNSTGEVSA